MQVKEIAITRIFNIGNYENIRYEVRVALDIIDEPKASILSAERIISEYWEKRSTELKAHE
jgi:hypothetical protein